MLLKDQMAEHLSGSKGSGNIGNNLRVIAYSRRGPNRREKMRWDCVS